MTWGQKNGINDLVDKIKNNKVNAMYILDNRKISNQQMVTLANVLSDNTSIKEFYFSANGIQQETLFHFAETFKFNKNLKLISFGNHMLSDTGMEILFDNGFRYNSSIEKYDLEYKGLTLESSKTLKKMGTILLQMIELNISRNCIQDKGLNMFCKGLLNNNLNQLKILDISNNKIQLDMNEINYICKFIQNNDFCKLECINISDNLLLEDGSKKILSSLAKNKVLKTVSFRKCGLTKNVSNELYNLFQNNKNLEEIDLEENNFSDEGICCFLKDFKKSCIKKLNLSKNMMSDLPITLFMEEFHSNDIMSLDQLNLSYNKLTYKSLQNLLKLKSLRELRLFNNNICEGIFHCLNHLKTNDHLELLDVGANEMHGNITAPLFDALHCNHHLQTLEIGGNHLDEVAQIALKNLKNIRPDLDIAFDKIESN